jgi:prepilin-type N-terminal cleavage/methylation domain-containing protein
MRSNLRKSNRGFTLVEMLIAMALAAFVLGLAVRLYTKGLEATWTVSQRAELQQDARASFNLLTKDISLANAGFSDTPYYSGIGLATGGVTNPRLGCDFTGACHLGAANNAARVFPVNGGINYMYGVIPGWQQGATINGAVGPTDAITVVYLDNAFLLNKYLVRFNDLNGNSISFQVPVPAPNPAPQAVNNSAVGLQRGDLVLFQNGSQGVIAEVTAPVPAGAGPTYTVSFADQSPLGFNQNNAASGNLRNAIIQNNPARVGMYMPATTTATRVWLITYYVDRTRPTPTLMRLVNGRLPIPVAENVADLRFTYNSYSTTGALINNTGDGGLSNVPPIMPSSIRTINLTRLTLRSQSRGAKGYQSVDLHSSISARNMGFIDRYQ